MTTSPRSDRKGTASKISTLAVVALVLSSYSAVSSSAHPTWTHTIEDSRGEGLRTSVLSYHFTPPEVDMWWVDVIPLDDALEVSWRVANLSHRTFAPQLEGLGFSCWWALRHPDGTYGESQAVYAQYGTFNATGFWTVFHYSERWGSTHDVEGEFDWANDTVRVRVPLSYFESGSTLVNPLAYASVETQNKAGIHTGFVEWDDYAPDTGYVTSDVPIP